MRPPAGKKRRDPIAAARLLLIEAGRPLLAVAAIAAADD